MEYGSPLKGLGDDEEHVRTITCWRCVCVCVILSRGSIPPTLSCAVDILC